MKKLPKPTTTQTCPGCKAVSLVPADPDLQPTSCAHCNYPIRMVRDYVSNVFAIEYSDRREIA